VLATAIRGDNEIKGISVGNIECKLSQYADDPTMILDGSQASLERSFALLDSFGQLSGLRVNCEKTEVLWIGSKKVQNIKDLISDDFTAITYRDLKEKHRLSASFLDFYGVTSAIRNAMKSLKLKTQDEDDQGFSVQKLIAAAKPTKLAYKILIKKNITTPEKSQEKWVKDCALEEAEDLSLRSIYLLPRVCTLSTKIRN